MSNQKIVLVKEDSLDEINGFIEKGGFDLKVLLSTSNGFYVNVERRPFRPDFGAIEATLDVLQPVQTQTWTPVIVDDEIVDAILNNAKIQQWINSRIATTLAELGKVPDATETI